MEEREEREQKSERKESAIGGLSQIHKNKEASERQPSDKVGARGRQCHPFCTNRRRSGPSGGDLGSEVWPPVP